MSIELSATCFDSILIDRDENGDFTLHIESVEAGDVLIRLSPSVNLALNECILQAITLQRELDQLDPVIKNGFPLEMARGVVRGNAFFKALAPDVLLAQQLDGMFGTTVRGES